jgi:tRNA (guanosine-2'-O-)-methyltransferase
MGTRGARRRRGFARGAAPVTLALALVGCGPSLPPLAPGSNLVAKNVVTSDGIVVNSACTPTGPELCFNATDDNCNGVIDEGCGVGTGVLQFVVAWGDSPADLDLAVTDPNGGKVHKSSRSSSAGLQLEKNCPEDGCHGQNVENVFFDGAEPPRGKYTVEVKLVDPHGAELPVKARLSARVGNRTYAMDLVLAPGGAQEKHVFSFEL